MWKQEGPCERAEGGLAPLQLMPTPPAQGMGHSVKPADCNGIIVYSPLKSFWSRGRRLIWGTKWVRIHGGKSPPRHRCCSKKDSLLLQGCWNRLMTLICISFLTPSREISASITWCLERHSPPSIPSSQLDVFFPSKFNENTFCHEASLIYYNIFLKLSQGHADCQGTIACWQTEEAMKQLSESVDGSCRFC